MDGLAQSEYEHSASSELQGPGSTLRTDGYLSTPRPAEHCGPGFVVFYHRVRKVCPGWVPDGEGGGISDAAFGMVFPLAGGRCVPRTGVRLDCPLEVALPASLPCLSLLPYSGATCSSSRAGALEWGKTVENAAAAWIIPTVDLEIPLLGGNHLRQMEKVFLFFSKRRTSYVRELLKGTPPGAAMTRT